MKQKHKKNGAETGVRSRDWSDHFDEWLLVAATRYYTGRMTAAACDFACRLAEAWDKIPAPARNCIQRDLQEAFDADDAARERGDSWRPLGHNCDRQSWEKVRAKWANDKLRDGKGSQP